MNFDLEFGRLQQAWNLAWQTRFCPPDRLLMESALTSQAEAHLKACPICRRRKEFACIQEKLPSLTGAPDKQSGRKSRGAEPKAGQIRSLNPALACWGPKERYYNPPLVLVLDAQGNLPNGVLVAQCHHDLTFMAQDDVLIEKDRFAEPWNIYTLHHAYLGPVLADIDRSLLTEVLKSSQKDVAELPVWSALYLFRQMEIELGCFFSSSALIALMEEYDGLASPMGDLAAFGRQAAQSPGQSDVVWLTHAPEDLPDCLRELGLKLPSEAKPVKPTDLYFLAQEAGLLDMAAADTETARSIKVVSFRVIQGRPVSYEVVNAQLTDVVRSPELILGGKITSHPIKEGENYQAEFRWLTDDGTLLKSRASYISWQKDEPIWFWVSFDLDAYEIDNIEKRFQMRLFYEQGN